MKSFYWSIALLLALVLGIALGFFARGLGSASSNTDIIARIHNQQELESVARDALAVRIGAPSDMLEIRDVQFQTAGQVTQREMTTGFDRAVFLIRRKDAPSREYILRLMRRSETVFSVEHDEAK